MITDKKPELRSDVFYIRELTLEPLVKYCSKTTGNNVLQELEVEHITDYHAIRIFCGCLDNWNGEHILFDNTLLNKEHSSPITIKQGTLENFKNGCHINFINHKDLKDKVNLTYCDQTGCMQTVSVPKDSIDLYLHTLRLLKVERKIYIDPDSYVR